MLPIWAVPADAAQEAGLTLVGTNIYPYTNKPVAGSQINWARPLAAGLASAVPLYEGAGTNFYDAARQESYAARSLSGSPTNASPPAWFNPASVPGYPWAGPAISNNNAQAQAIQTPFLHSELLTNITAGYSYAMLVQPLDTTTFGRTLDATGSAVITMYLNVFGRPGEVATTWRDAADDALNPYVPFQVNQWMLVLCTVQDGLGMMYLNGLPVATNTNVSLAMSLAGQAGQLVYNCTGNGAMMPNANFSSWWIWTNRALSGLEAAQLYADPWSMFHSGAQKGFIKGTQVALTNAAVVGDVFFYSHVAAGNVRLALYDDASPKNLIWQSGAISNTVAGAWLATPVSGGNPTALALAPGNYWLAWQVDTTYDVPSYIAGNSGDGFSFSQTFGSFPATLSGEHYTAETWSAYFDYESPIPPTITGLAFEPGGTLQILLPNSQNMPYRLLASTNLTDWVGLAVPMLETNGLTVFFDTNTGAFDRRFYRAVWP